MGGVQQQAANDAALAYERLGAFGDWLGIHPSEQDLVKAILLTIFVLVILMILGDVYRGEIQNTFHRIRLIPNPGKDENANHRHSLQVPKYVVQPTLDGIYSNALFYFRYRDYRGKLRTKPLYSYRVRFRVRTAFQNTWAPGHENDHAYTEDEKIHLAKEKPDLESGSRPISEIVAMARSRVDYIQALQGRAVARNDQLWGRLERSWLWRRVYGIRKSVLREPEPIGLVVKFHFPIDPYFLLYRHPDTNVRSTAWLTVLTSVFALFMQLVYSQQSSPLQGRERAPEQVSHPRVQEHASLTSAPLQSEDGSP